MDSQQLNDYKKEILKKWLQDKGLKDQNISDWCYVKSNKFCVDQKKLKEHSLKFQDYTKFERDQLLEAPSNVASMKFKDGTQSIDVRPEEKAILEGMQQKCVEFLNEKKRVYTTLPGAGYGNNMAQNRSLHGAATVIAQDFINRSKRMMKEGEKTDTYAHVEIAEDIPLEEEHSVILVSSALLNLSKKMQERKIISEEEQMVFSKVMNDLLSITRSPDIKSGTDHHKVFPAVHDKYTTEIQQVRKLGKGKGKVSKTNQENVREFTCTHNSELIIKEMQQAKRYVKDYMTYLGRYHSKKICIRRVFDAKEAKIVTPTLEDGASFVIPIGIPVCLSDGQRLIDSDFSASIRQSGSKAVAQNLAIELNKIGDQMRAFDIESLTYNKNICQYPQVHNSLYESMMSYYTAITGDSSRTRVKYWKNLIKPYIYRSTKEEFTRSLESLSKTVPVGHSLHYVYTQLHDLLSLEVNLEWSPFRKVLDPEDVQKALIPAWKASGAKLFVDKQEYLHSLYKNLEKHNVNLGADKCHFGYPAHYAAEPYMREWQALQYEQAAPKTILGVLSNAGLPELVTKYSSLLNEIANAISEKEFNELFNMDQLNPNKKAKLFVPGDEILQLARVFYYTSSHPRLINDSLHSQPINIPIYMNLLANAAAKSRKETGLPSPIDTSSFHAFLVQVATKLSQRDEAPKLLLTASAAVSEFVRSISLKEGPKNNSAYDTLIKLLIANHIGVIDDEFWEGLNQYLRNTSFFDIQELINQELSGHTTVLCNIANKIWTSVFAGKPLSEEELQSLWGEKYPKISELLNLPSSGNPCI